MRVVRDPGRREETITPLRPAQEWTAPRESCDADQACDRAKYQVLISAFSSSLFFCGHHYRKHEEAFIERGYVVEAL